MDGWMTFFFFLIAAAVWLGCRRLVRALDPQRGRPPGAAHLGQATVSSSSSSSKLFLIIFKFLKNLFNF
jgi:hypothetical protein